MLYRVLVLNPGSTSTKLAVFDGAVVRCEEKVLHALNSAENDIIYRKGLAKAFLVRNHVELGTIECVVARGGLMRPISAGIYEINEQMLADLANPELHGKAHPSNLGAFIAKAIASEVGPQCGAYIADPPVVDEFHEMARISGVASIQRVSQHHALNIRYTARRLAGELGRCVEECNFIAVHLGGGISVVAMRKGRMIDGNCALLGMGPFSPQRAGALPIKDVVELCFDRGMTKGQVLDFLAKKSGWVSYLGTDDGTEVEARIAGGDELASLVHDAMCYQVAKEIGACATVLLGDVDAVFLTGGLARGKRLVDKISERIRFISDVIRVYPGEFEMEALAEAGVRVMKGIECAKKYLFD